MGCNVSKSNNTPTIRHDIQSYHLNSHKKPDYDFIFKIILIGDSGVGKSSLLSGFCDNVFSDSYVSTIGVDFRIKTFIINNKTIKLQIWDTAGQERFKSIINSYFRGTHGIILVYDITKPETFEHLSSWLDCVQQYTTHSDKIYTLVIGNKSDLHHCRHITTSQAKLFCDIHNIDYIETSAKNSDNVETAFYKLTHSLLSKY